MISPKKVLICGGTGFLGKRICEQAVARGWLVTSLSRSGRSAFRSIPPWAEKVDFQAQDLISISAQDLRALVNEADAVVYSLGILLESRYYKTFIASPDPIEGVKNIFNKWNQNPLKYPVQDDLTYATMNRDLAIKLATETAAAAAETNTTKPFVYISAATGDLPFVLSGYFESKAQAESAISKFASLRTIFLRPGIMFDPEKSMTMNMAFGLRALLSFNSMLGGNLPLLSSSYINPLSTLTVSAAAVEAIDDPSISGPVEIAKLKDLAMKGSAVI
ncbi:uncharacterized protein V1516DRAFT_452805 [Lipomyces oligophaga]|uniref:uncharacterized protein n=1 Tax=Lipomyces oligophaga TaxID=45792 RepID=UPI0034CE34C2